MGASLGPQLPFTLRISLSGDQEVVRGLLGFEVYISDLTPAWDGVDQAFHAIVAQQFASEGEHGGRPWAPLARSTQLSRARRGLGPAHPILHATGDLERSLTSLNADAISVHAPRSYRRGTGVEYYTYHVRGTRRMLARPPVELTAADREEVVRPVRVFVRSGIAAMGGLARYADQSFAATTGGPR
jgi:hypothetical protein